MTRDQESSVAYLVMGLGLGLLAGLLWAPRRGQEMRGGLRSGAAAGWNRIAGETVKLRGDAQHWLQIIKDRLSCRMNGGAKNETTD